jgi:uncharacterized heparinase superfamily protein
VARKCKRPNLALGTEQKVRASRPLLTIDPWRQNPVNASGHFTFLNDARSIPEGRDWNPRGVPKLWLYNLHYFDWLSALPAPASEPGSETATYWINRWIAENPPPHGNGWEPYPLSIRIVNWIKWLLDAPALGTGDARPMHRSLELQAHVLSQCLEFDIPGNHLIANAKALTFAGCYFEGAAADDWFDRGASVLASELDEQVLTDGGYFELSPMYHAIILEDVLDLVSLEQAYPQRPWVDHGLQRLRLEGIVDSMLGWLDALTHPDGRIGLFNDAATGIAADLAMLIRYAERLGLKITRRSQTQGVRQLNASGYVRVDRGPTAAILDVGRIGPDHLPAHAHADTLTFEWSLAGRRFIVNSGTSLYGESAERLRQRGTAAHNTVVVDEQDSSEIWKGFRVARRAYPYDIAVNTVSDPWTVSAAHDGYRRLPGRVIHRRRWEFEPHELRIVDRVHGTHRTARARFHLDPALAPRLSDAKTGVLTHAEGPFARFVVDKGHAWLEESTYHPQFGHSVRNQCLVVDLEHGESSIAFSFGSAIRSQPITVGARGLGET